MSSSVRLGRSREKQGVRSVTRATSPEKDGKLAGNARQGARPLMAPPPVVSVNRETSLKTEQRPAASAVKASILVSGGTPVSRVPQVRSLRLSLVWL